jgi:phosphatidate cytidylyltransferase
MLKQRLIVAILLLPVGIWVIHSGGWFFTLFIAALIGLAGWEYAQLFRACGYQPANWLVVVGAIALVITRLVDGFASAPGLIGLLILGGMAYHLFAYERGRDQAATDFSITLSGAIYLGWLGAYLVSIRALPDGEWWLLTVLCGVWFADSGAFFIGRRFGRRKLSPRLSPKKTWEGYFGGVVVGALCGALFGALWGLGATRGAAINLVSGAILGLLMGVLTPLGDLGESMIKRQAGFKDSGTLFPGHGGAFDRIDSWIWAAIIGYYAIIWLF